MRFTFPEPLHGWRAFIGEVGIIVLGVLIALSAQEIVGNIHEASDVEQLRKGIRAELANDRARWDTIYRQTPCAQQRLNAIDEWAASAGGRARLASLPLPHFWNLHWSTWDTAKSTGILERFPLSERLTYSDLYDAIGNQQRYIFSAQTQWETIASLAKTADERSARQRLREALALEHYDPIIFRSKANYEYLTKRFDQLGIKADSSGLTLAATNNDARELCAPLSSNG